MILKKAIFNKTIKIEENKTTEVTIPSDRTTDEYYILPVRTIKIDGKKR